jgi:F-box domain
MIYPMSEQTSQGWEELNSKKANLVTYASAPLSSLPQLSRTQDTMGTNRSLETLPEDIINNIVPFVDFRDYHNLRLVCRLLLVRHPWCPETKAIIAPS